MSNESKSNSSKNLKARTITKKHFFNLELIKEEIKKIGQENVDIQKAVEILFKLKKSNFKTGETIELHCKLNIDSTKSDQLVRGSVILPFGSGKEVKICAFVSAENEKIALESGADIIGTEEVIEKIKNTGKIDFDVAVADTETIKKLLPIAKILGIAGSMPSPKNNTLSDNVKEMITSLKSGRVDFKNDKTGNLHIIVGKLNSSFDEEKVIKNIEATISTIEKLKPEVIKKKYIISTHISGTHTPSIKISKI